MQGIQKYFRIISFLALIFIMGSISAQTLDEARTLYNEGGTAAQEGNIELAIQKFNECISICEKLYEDEEDLDAESLMISLQPKIPKLYYQLSISKMKEKDVAAGIENARMAKETAAQYNDEETLQKSKELLGKIHYSIALSKYKAEKMDEAIAELDKAIAESNDLKAYNLKLVILKDGSQSDLLLETAKAAISAAEAEKDVDSKEKFIQLAATYFYNAGVLAKQSSNYDEALKNIRTSLKFNSENADAYFLLTDIYNSQSDWENAISSGNEGLKYEASDSQARFYYELGNAYYGNGDNAAACEAYSKAAVGEYAENAKYQMEYVVKCE